MKIIWKNYLKSQNIFYLFNLSEMTNIKRTKNTENDLLGFTGVWIPIVAYIDENNIDKHHNID